VFNVLPVPKKQPFNRIERFLQKFPTWLFVTGVVGAIAGTAIWVDPIVNIHSSDKEIIGVLLQNVEVMAIVAALIVYLKEVPERKAQRHYEAWQVIDSAATAKVATSYARKQALEDLNRDGVSLRKINIAGADLEGINLQQADLCDANLNGANLGGANLEGANLNGANLEGATLLIANLRGATLIGANLNNSILEHAKLSFVNLGSTSCRDAKLSYACLRRAYLRGVDLTNAKLTHARLNEAFLGETNLTNADFYGADLSYACFTDVNFGDAEGWTEIQLGFAKLCGTKLPEGCRLKPNRDCKNN